ncbi:hypothetical protein TNCT_596501 [Trichonephila clavata]|uniref:Uncharacterized protein n=1 Tax=Trichonephila clavata TaxID=2740835 RepID=A0A8X6HZI3_TRICU|nr:hypothetical protein TNCT_596501 [Trichonephila clavata]
MDTIHSNLPAIYTQGKKPINTQHNIARLIQLHPLEQKYVGVSPTSSGLESLQQLSSNIWLGPLAWKFSRAQVATPSLNTASTPRNIPCVIL